MTEQNTDDGTPVSFWDKRSWAGVFASSGTYIGIVFGWMFVTSLILGINFLDIGKSTFVKWLAIGLIGGLAAMPALKLGERLRNRIDP